MKKQKNQDRKNLIPAISLALVPVALTALMSCGWIRIDKSRSTTEEEHNLILIRETQTSTTQSFTSQSVSTASTETKAETTVKTTQATSIAETETTPVTAPETTTPRTTERITTQTTAPRVTTKATTETTRAPETLPTQNGETNIYWEYKQTRKIIVPYETEYIYSEKEYEDVTRVVTEGKNGMREVSETMRYNGVAFTAVETEILSYTPPVNKVILKGTKPVYTYENKTVNENTVAYSVKYKDDASLYEGETSVSVKGKNGGTINTYSVTYERGIEIFRELVSSVVTAPTDEIVLRGTKPVYSYKTETVTENKIPFETKYVNDASLYVGQTSVRTEGRDGYSVNTYKITYTRGVETSREIVSSSVTAPIAKVIAVGTKKKEESFIMPFADASRGGYDYSVTQYFGGTNDHGGIDFAVWYGQPITAAMSGTVIYAYNNGYLSSSDLRWTYGTFVVIDHGNGYLTYYAHLSSRTVSVGDKVTQGQTIGYSGNTGRVSPAPTASNKYAGTHLHFEIRKYIQGAYVKVNPKNYLPWWN